MPRPSPFHPRTAEACTSLLWKEWAGYHAVRSYDTCHEREYYAIRHGAALIDVTPLHKVEVTGPDAVRLLSWVTVRDVAKLAVGRTTYLCWCDDAGRVLDDGTVTRLAEEHYRFTSAEPALRWLERQARGLAVGLSDSSDRTAALAVQGPRSRDLLAAVCDADLDALRFFGATPARFRGPSDFGGPRDFEGTITRTGYTGDLGYEVWVANEDALPLWDALADVGPAYGAMPVGLDAMDVSRIEAGFVLGGVDYAHAAHAISEDRKLTPMELGLGWTVKLDRGPFVGRDALLAERERGPARRTVGLELDWERIEWLFERRGLPPELPATAWRGAEPVYAAGRWVGRATSGTWSPTLKKVLALGLVASDRAEAGTPLEMEMVVDYRRERVPAVVVDTPFFDPPRKRRTPAVEAAKAAAREAGAPSTAGTAGAAS